MGKLTLGLEPHPATRPDRLEEVAASYEFTKPQEETIARLAQVMRFVGIFMVIAGVISGIAAVIAAVDGRFVTSIGSSVSAVIDIVLGLYLTGAAAGFRLVVETRGADIPHLMLALDELRKFFSLQRLLILVAIALGVLAIVFLLF